MVATRATCLNRVQGSAHRNCWAHFDNREGQAGMDLCIYCDVGFGFRSSPPIWGVVDPWGGVAKWLAATHADPLREIQKSVNTTLAHSFTRSCWQHNRNPSAQGRFQRAIEARAGRFHASATFTIAIVFRHSEHSTLRNPPLSYLVHVGEEEWQFECM